jgi:hypothetical protein
VPPRPTLTPRARGPARRHRGAIARQAPQPPSARPALRATSAPRWRRRRSAAPPVRTAWAAVARPWCVRRGTSGTLPGSRVPRAAASARLGTTALRTPPPGRRPRAPPGATLTCMGPYLPPAWDPVHSATTALRARRPPRPRRALGGHLGTRAGLVRPRAAVCVLRGTIVCRARHLRRRRR